MTSTEDRAVKLKMAVEALGRTPPETILPPNCTDLLARSAYADAPAEMPMLIRSSAVRC